MRKLLLCMFIVVVSVEGASSQDTIGKTKDTPVQRHSLDCVVQNYIKAGEDNYYADKFSAKLNIFCYKDSCNLSVFYESKGDLEGFRVSFLEKDLSEGKCEIKFNKDLVEDAFIALDAYYYEIIKDSKYLNGTFPLGITFKYKNKEYQFHFTCNVVKQQIYRR